MMNRNEIMQLFDEKRDMTEARVKAGIEQNRKGLCKINFCDKDGKPVGLKLPPTVDPSDFYPYVRLYETRQENGKDYSCYFVYKESHKMDSKEFARLVDGAIEEAKELGIQTDTPEQLARYKEEWSK